MSATQGHAVIRPLGTVTAVDDANPVRSSTAPPPRRATTAAWLPDFDPVRLFADADDVGDRRLAAALADVELTRPRWHREAACRGNVKMFFSKKPHVIETAKRMCITCPVQGPCDAAAAAGDDVGVWAGRTQQERRAARRAA